MPRTPEEFNDYVAKELRAEDKRMDEIVKTVAALFDAIDVTELGPWAAMARLGLVMAQAEAVE